MRANPARQSEEKHRDDITIYAVVAAVVYWANYIRACTQVCCGIKKVGESRPTSTDDADDNFDIGEHDSNRI